MVKSVFKKKKKFTQKVVDSGSPWSQIGSPQETEPHPGIFPAKQVKSSSRVFVVYTTFIFKEQATD